MLTIFDKSIPGRTATQLPSPAEKESELEKNMTRGELDLPELSEVDVVRHYTALSKRAFGVDDGFYPLGSCTMKYNPKINENMAALPDFLNFHPWQDEEDSQGSLEVIYNLQEYLKECTGFAGVNLQPAAGSHGELTGVMLMKKYHEDHGDTKRTKILIPDSAHGTNPATVSMCGFTTVNVPSDSNGCVDLKAMRELIDDETVGMMLTIPNTLGLFDRNILEISKILHDNGALLYMDGANLNAILGMVKPADMGVDMMHINLHKTFSTPHGGGGPGGGVICCTEEVDPYLPIPRVEKREAGSRKQEAGSREKKSSAPGSKLPAPSYFLNYDYSKSIGRIRAFYGNFGILVRAYTYALRHGKEGTLRIGRNAVLNANYIRVNLKEHYHLPYDVNCMHEVVFNDEKQEQYHVTTMDIAKRLIDHRMHPPTVYFPTIIHGAMMIEPTETESKQTLDEFVDVMIEIAEEAKTNPEILQTAPHNAPVRRVDAVKAARNPVLVCHTCCS